MRSIFIVKAIFIFLLLMLIPLDLAEAAVSSQLKNPVLTPINGITVSSTPGQITLTNNSGKNISAANMTLTFNLAQSSVGSIWGSPWLNWTLAKGDGTSFQFTNQAKLPDNVLKVGDSISINYSPEPWNNSNAPQNVQLDTLTYPLEQASISATTSNQSGTNTITIINNSNQALSLDGAELHMNFNGQIHSSIWGAPWANWTVTESGSNDVFTANTTNTVPPNGSLTIIFNGDNAPISNIQLWVKSTGDVPPASKGEMDIALPAEPQGVTTNPQITLQGPSFPHGTQITGVWGQTLIEKDLLTGSYTVNAPDLATSNYLYTASINPNPAVVTDKQPVSVAVSYTVKQMGQLYIQMPAAPAISVAAPVVTVSGGDFATGKKITANWGQGFFVCPGDVTSCPGISAGNYTITAPLVFSTTDAYQAFDLAQPIAVTLGQTTNVPITYDEVAKGAFNTTLSMAAQNKNSKKILQQSFQINFANQEGYTFTKTLALGSNQVALPISDTYSITAQSISGYSASINPNVITVIQQGTPNVNIQYGTGTTNRFVVYYGGWEGDEYALTNLPSTVTAVMLSFANITATNQVDTAASGYLTTIPAQDSQMWPSYINWTTFKYSRPNTKIVLSVGGATYSAIWNSVLTADSADTIAKNIATVVNQSYPVYKSQFAHPADLIGSATIDGVDLDVEVGGDRLSPQVANNVILLVRDLQKYMNSGKLITFAGFSVGADPNGAQCTVPGSVHCGEDISILQQVGGIMDWVNVMAYDAGQDYAASKYQTALTNYVGYIGKNKTVLGLDIQSQWPGFQETAAELATKATWQKQNQYGGAMFWGVGVNNNPSQEQTFINAIATALGN